MRIGLGVCIMAIGMMANAASAESPHRLVAIVGQPDDLRVGEQHAALERGAGVLRERDVVIQYITPDATRRERPGLGVN